MLLLLLLCIISQELLLCTLVLVFLSASSPARGPEGFVSLEHHLFLLSGSRGSTKGDER